MEDATLRPTDSYRPDIDGLRALSVIIVVLFHAGLGMTGGFVGVDVFFVISGYLITSLILKQQAAGRFDLVEFFARRVRRIIPAVCVMTLATLVLGSFWLSPDAWVDLARSAVAQTAMVANVWHWRTINYFSTEAELKPFLHMWSLAVEEQFYLLYPFLLIMLGKCSRRTLFFVLSAFAAMSLVLAEYFLPTRASAVYYLLPFRAWELLLGGIVSLLPRRRPTPSTEAEVAVGLAMILIPAFLYDTQTRFPGLGALPPCLGAALVIYGGQAGNTMVGRFLSSRPMVGIGLLSYSIYLWHWPLLALARNLIGIRLPWPFAAGLILLGLGAAALSWRWVEEPVRRGSSFNSRRFSAKLFVATSGLILMVASAIIASQGVPGRFTPRTLGYFAARTDRPFRHQVSVDAAERGDFPSFGISEGRDCVMVWGDSHAMMIVPGVDAACRNFGISGIQATYSATPPLLGFIFHGSRYGLGAEGPRFNRAVVKTILERPVRLVVIAAHWENYADSTDFEQCLRETVDAITSAGIPVCLMLDVPSHPTPIPEALARRAIFGLGTADLVVSDREYQVQNRLANDIIRRVAGNRVVILDPREIMTDSSGNWVAELGGEALYEDSSHLSGAGARRLVPLFERLFQEVGLGIRGQP
jgi:peptidoglycan/LPS O-acetylase OafA/YrhL